MISQEAINLVTEATYYGDNMDVWTPNVFLTADTSSSHGTSNYDADIEHFCAPVVHPDTGETISNYKKLANDPVMREVWTKSLGKEFGSLAQGDDLTKTPGTNTLFVLDHEQIKNIPKDRTITYAKIVVDFRPQKADPNRVRITAGGNLIAYPGELTTRTTDLTT